MRASWFLLVLGWIATAFALDGPAYKDRFVGVPPPPIPPCNARKQKWQKILDDVSVYSNELRTRTDNAKNFIAYADRHNIFHDNVHLLRTYIRCCPTSHADRREKQVPWNDAPANEGFHLPWRTTPPSVLELRSMEAEDPEAGSWEEREHKGLEARDDPSSPEVCERDVGRLRAEAASVLAHIPALEYAAEEVDIRYYQDIKPANGTDLHMVRRQAVRLKTIHTRLVNALWRCCPMLNGIGPMPGGLKPYPSVPSQPPWPRPMEFRNYTEPEPEPVDPFDGRPPAEN
ncbi:hypothetical protein KJ359_005829 [Pestalotiopsis sp. 9143b]|nr:hypothetical protein KJ359_005829 [Pestalotiopsis sp. 9143b]